MDWLTDLLQYTISGLAQGSIYAIVAVGFAIIFSSTEIVNFAQGEFVMLGAMGSYTFLVLFPELLHISLPVLVAVPLAAVFALLIGLCLGWLLMRPLKDASPVSLIIITIGASILLQGLAAHFWGKDAVPVPNFTEGDAILLSLGSLFHREDMLPLVIMPQQLWVMGITAVLVLALTLFFNKTAVGKAMRAVAANRHGAKLIGVNVSRMVIGAFALSAAIGALAGAAIAPISCGYFNMGTMMGLKGFAAAIVGGLGNFPGAIIAGLLLGVMENFGAGYISSDYKDAFAFIILLAVLFISPRGILAFGRRKEA
ncbi:MAG: branched-chain amino acid ABC transporter permease [Armatimonadota bacterium]